MKTSDVRTIYIHDNKTIYTVDQNGIIFNSTNGHILVQSTDKNGYKIVSLNCKSKNYKCKVHRLVAIAFIPNPHNKPTVNHKDGNKSNNCVDNLEWATHKEQIRHAFKYKLSHTLCGEMNGASKYTEKQIRQACILILENSYSDYAIERKCGLNRGYVYVLRKKLAWKNVTDNYFTEEGSTTIENNENQYYTIDIHL